MADQDLPGYAPERPLWQPPAVIPSGSVGELARAVQTALAGISGALQQLGGRRNVLPLQGNLDARDGQVIAGVASGQVITLPSPNLGQFGSVTVIVTAVSSAATVVSPDGSSYELDQTGVYEFAISPDDTAWRAPPWLSSTGVGFDWSTVLDKGRSSGAHNPKIASGQYLELGDGSATLPSFGDIRASSSLDIRAGSFAQVFGQTSVSITANTAAITLTAATNMQLRPQTDYLWCNPGGSFYIYTAGTNRLQVSTNGTWYLGASFTPGTSGQVITSQGDGSPPIWSTIDLSSVTYTAGDGIDLASNVFSADVSDFAGSGLEDDGSNNLRIAAAAAGDGLTGGGGSALAVDVTDLIGATDSAIGEDGSNNLEYTGTTSNINVTGVSGDLGTIDISALKCGGVYSIQSLSGAAIVRGFTSTPDKPDGFWFVLNMRDSTTTSVLGILDNDAGATTAIRTSLAGTEYMAAGQSAVLVRSNTRWRLQSPPNFRATLASTQTATNTTSALTGKSQVIPARSLQDGSVFRVEGMIVVSRGTTATAATLSVNIALGGTNYATATFTIPTTTSTSFGLHVVGFLRCTGTGASGTFIANIAGAGGLTTVATASVNTANSGTTKDTTSDQTLALTASMSAAVANLSTRFTHATIERVQ